jgi:electron transport complex protein RnfE
VYIYALLALVPLGVAATSTLQGLGLGLISFAILFFGSIAVHPLAARIHPRLRIPIAILISGALIVCLQLLLSAYLHALYLAVGAYAPLLAAAFIGAGFDENRTPSLRLSAQNGALLGAAALLFMTGTGLIREVLSHGGLLLDAATLLGEQHAGLSIHFDSAERWALVVGLPSGGFLIVGIGLTVFAIRSRARRAAETAGQVHEQQKTR